MARAPQPKMKEPPEGYVNTLIMADVFLPLDDEGNVRPNWRNAPGTLRELMAAAQIEDMSDPGARNLLRETAARLDSKPVAKRTRLAMPLDLAEIMEAREQVEII